MEDFERFEPALWQTHGVLQKILPRLSKPRRVLERGTHWAFGATLAVAFAFAGTCGDLRLGHTDIAGEASAGRHEPMPDATGDRDDVVPVGHWARLGALLDTRSVSPERKEIDDDPL